MEVRYGTEANMAYIREALAERLTDPKRDPARDVSLVLKVLSFLVDRSVPRWQDDLNARETARLRVRYYDERDEGPRDDAYLREQPRRTRREYYDVEPCVINFERAKAEILTRRNEERARRVEAYREAEERPRLKIFRAE